MQWETGIFYTLGRVKYLDLFIYKHVYTCSLLLTLSSTNGRWTDVTVEKLWNYADTVGKKEIFRKKLSHHNSLTHPPAIQQFPDIYNRSSCRNWYITILSLILLIPTHVALITNTTTNTSLFRSANTNLRMWSCTAANMRHCHSTEGNTATICYLTYHSCLTTISSNKAHTTAAQIMTL